MNTKTGRHEAREYSFQFLYHLQLGTFAELRQKLSSENNDGYLKGIVTSFQDTIELKLPSDIFNFSYDIIKGTIRNYNEIEKIIEGLSQNWQLHRISKVDHTILLQAIFELKYMKDTPEKVVINEAIELAKKFGHLESKNFVNGILDSVLKSLNHE